MDTRILASAVRLMIALQWYQLLDLHLLSVTNYSVKWIDTYIAKLCEIANRESDICAVSLLPSFHAHGQLTSICMNGKKWRRSRRLALCPTRLMSLATWSSHFNLSPSTLILRCSRCSSTAIRHGQHSHSEEAAHDGPDRVLEHPASTPQAVYP
jgi:hypothetical protein